MRIPSISKLVFYWIPAAAMLVGYPFIGYDIIAGGFEIHGDQLISMQFLEGTYLYIIHHLLSFIPVFFFGIVLNWFDYRNAVWKELLVPLVMMALIFIAWDILFTALGVWRFNPAYIQGVSIINLPWEEVCWFFIIPFCSLFVYQIVKIRWSNPWGSARTLQFVLLVVLFGMYLLNMDRIYSATSLSMTISMIGLSLIVNWKGFGLFIASFLLLLIPMGLFNGMLTGLLTKEALVQYNSAEFGGIRILSFPIEDIGFGFGFLIGILLLSDFIKHRLSADYTLTK
ncbi:MAG: lycopene cyclase domain-containing protein [Saprospiraceae bacterium]|nr:lycopene cyclase domain-containing protein [Saprospiraceae bacterium]MBK7737983.1 lycopene cyclase domain-containing protein [Saprospiraceae bacterium]MBK7913438.1 lycopene cyclase domain-containing protein [Saprospiraceae bacterium]